MRYELTNLEPLLEDAKKRMKDDSPWGPFWYSFPQTWGSTALGFGGIGGQAITSAQTIVVGKHPAPVGGTWLVYFGGSFAYSVENPNEKFFEDLMNWHMASVREHGKYKRTDPARI